MFLAPLRSDLGESLLIITLLGIPLGEPDDKTPTQTGSHDRSDRSNAEWLQQRIEHYRTRTNDMCETIKESEDMDKLG